MTLVLSAAAIALGLAGAFLPYIVTFFPGVGVALVYRLRVLLWIILVITLALALGAYMIAPSVRQAIVLIISLFLAGLGFLFSPQRIFVALKNPPRVGKTEAQIEDDGLVLGLEHGEEAIAWPYFEMIAPHHLINDQSGGTPLLVAY